MENRPMPIAAVAVMSGLLVGLACTMAWRGIALAADGAFQLVRVLSAGDLYGQDARFLAVAVHQGAVVLAANAGVTDTRLLTVAFGIGQLVLPALAWSLAIVLTRDDRLTCAAVAMVAGLSAGATWFVNVSEIVLAAPLTVLVAVLLWRPHPWRLRDSALAILAATVLVASYETALLTAAVLAVWATWRAASRSGDVDSLGCAVVALLSALGVVVAIWGTRTGSNPTHSQSLVYFVVSLEPWPFYVGLGGIVAAVAGLGPWLRGLTRLLMVALGCVLLVAAVAGSKPDVITAFQARGGAAVAAFLLEVFLLWRWIERRRSLARRIDQRDARRREVERVLVVLSVGYVAAMVLLNLHAVRGWSRSLDAFRHEVDRAHGVVYATDVLPTDKRDVLFDWTSSSLSLVVRSNPDAGILVDRNPAVVAFPIADAREQVDDSYTWSR